MPTSSASRPAGILAAPALHFAVAGVLLFAGSRLLESAGWTFGAATPGSHVIVVDAARVEGLKRDYALSNQGKASTEETRALVDRMVSDEILFREGLARGFELGDRSIAWRLVQKMRFLGEDHGEDVGTLYQRALAMGLHLSDPVVRQVLVEKVRLVVGWSSPAPSDEELAAWYAEHQSEYGQAERVTLTHVFFDRQRRGAEGAKAKADEAAIKSTGQGVDVAAALGGDPFVMGKRLTGQGPNDLGKFFGPAFSKEALTLPAGQWQGPIESVFGWHLVFIEKRFDPRVPELAEVRSRVEKGYENFRRAGRLAEFLESVRPNYTVRIDEAAIGGGSDD